MTLVPSRPSAHLLQPLLQSLQLALLALWRTPLLSLHGVRPEMSALAASTDPKARAAARAAAATALPTGARSSAEHDAARAARTCGRLGQRAEA